MKTISIWILCALLGVVGCESKSKKDGDALLEKIDQQHNKQKNDLETTSESDKKARIRSISFRHDASVAFLDLKAWMIHQEYVDKLEGNLSAQTSAGATELASQKYQEGKKEADEAEAAYEASVKKMEESAPDRDAARKVLNYLRKYRVKDAQFQAEIAEARAAKAITGQADPELVKDKEASYKEFRALDAEDWMVDLKFEK